MKVDKFYQVQNISCKTKSLKSGPMWSPLLNIKRHPFSLKTFIHHVIVRIKKQVYGKFPSLLERWRIQLGQIEDSAWITQLLISQVALVVKNLPANAGDTRHMDLTLGLGRSPGERHGNPLQHSCLGNPVDRGSWWATVHGVARSQTRLKWLNMHMSSSSVFTP